MIEKFGAWTLENKANYDFFVHCRNELVPQVRQGYRILWSVSRSLDADGVYRGAANLRGYYAKHSRPAFGVQPEVQPHG